MSAPVFADLVGQEHVIASLESALSQAKSTSQGQEMTHAWLFTGPPGSGRSTAARAFAAALLCNENGCGICIECKSSASGTHPDIDVVDATGLSIKIDELREVVSRSAWGTTLSKWRVILIEDCDRMTESAANALLKALEEPTGDTVWLLCAPTIHDVLPTIRSRCRQVNLRTPSTSEIVDFLTETHHAKQDEAELAARISQGHVGKARAFLNNSDYRTNRKQTIEIFISITSEPRAIRAAAQLLELAVYRAESRVNTKSELELEELKSALQGTGRGMISGGAKVIKDLERDQKARLTRATKDELDAILLDLELFLADCLAPSELWRNIDLSEIIRDISSTLTPEAIASLVPRIKQTRESLTGNSSQALLLESLALDFSRLHTGN